MPRYGIRLHSLMTPQACVEQAVAAEKAGFDSIWFAENPYQRGVLPAVAACIVATRAITVGIGVFNPFNRHPTLMAMEMGALDELAGGRTVLGIGAGVARQLRKAGFTYDRPLAAMRDAVHIVRGLMRGDAVSHDGRVFSARDIRLEFTPPRPDYPIYMAAMGDRALGLSGEIADGLMISNMCPPGYSLRAVGLMREGAQRAGRPQPANVVQYAPCVAGADRGEARQIVRQRLAPMIVSMWKAGEQSPFVRRSMVAESGIAEAGFATLVGALGAGAAPGEVVEDRFLDRYAVAGDGGDCRAAIARYVAAGVSEMVVTFVGPDPVGDMGYFARAVLAGRPAVDGAQAG